MKYSTYQNLKPCQHPWIDDLPEHWNFLDLKFLADCFPSNVDKKTKENEIPVFLCNYTDVYYNDEIHSGLQFMKASATGEQVRKFSLKQNDVIITKDSEDPDDIAIPSVVKNDLNNVLCGYHLALIRAKEDNDGRFIKWFFESRFARSLFSTTCNGMTRYGLGTYALKNANFARPPRQEQTQIAAFLDRETAKIDQLIEKQQRLIKLLKEKRQAVISHAVTTGLNSDVQMKNSGIEWLGEVPTHWDVVPLKYLVRTSKGVAFKSSDFTEDGVGVVKASDIKQGSIRSTSTNLPESFLRSHRAAVLKAGDIILSTVGSTPDVINSAVGQIGEVTPELDGSLLNQNTVNFKPTRRLNSQFMKYFLFSTAYRKHLDLCAHGTANQASLSLEDMLSFGIALPPADEQTQIVIKTTNTLELIDSLIRASEKSILLSREKKQALISAAVTGKIDVRDQVPQDVEEAVAS